MSDTRRAVLFVTEELFLPKPHNGSADVYIRSAQDYARQGYEVFCVSFVRDRQQVSDTSIRSSYASMFSDFLLLPGWNGGGTVLGQVSLGWREISRWVTGNIFAKNRLLALLLRPHLAQLVRFVRRHEIGTVFFHKPQTVLLLSDILPLLRPTRLIVDLHDDFVERELHYRRAYGAFFANVPAAEIARSYGKQYLRHRLSRISAVWSREVETRLLAQCDQVLFSSIEEYRRYLPRPELTGKLVHKPRKFAKPERTLPAASTTLFDAGFIGSDDVMNLDGLIWFCREVMPRIQRSRPDFQLLVAGSIGAKAKRLLRGLDSVTIWGSLDDVASFYQAIDMLVVPLRYGTGTSTKVHEALAFGWPIVSTSIGVRGIPGEEISGITVADQPEAFAAGVLARLRVRARSAPVIVTPQAVLVTS
jgi:glycosyltransferase involved in cell wall biosynthesis